jgi:hypothetical protein
MLKIYSTICGTMTTDHRTMSKVILEFDGLEEQQEARTALDGWKWQHVVWEMDQYLRAEMKYSSLSDAEYSAMEKSREKLRELVSDNNLSLDT